MSELYRKTTARLMSNFKFGESEASAADRNFRRLMRDNKSFEKFHSYGLFKHRARVI